MKANDELCGMNDELKRLSFIHPAKFIVHHLLFIPHLFTCARGQSARISLTAEYRKQTQALTSRAAREIGREIFAWSDARPAGTATTSGWRCRWWLTVTRAT